jgi:hypothetical protein
VPVGRGRLEGERRRRCARRERGEDVAGRRFFGGLTSEVNQARAIGVLQRMDQGRLPAGKQRRREQQPRE